MKKQLIYAFLGIVSLSFLASCRGPKKNDRADKNSCTTRYAYNDCNDCYEVGATDARVTYDNEGSFEDGSTTLHKF